jgi:hypothetical protein
MPTTRQSRRNRSEQLDLLNPPPAHPTWGRLPEKCRQEARRLLAQMFIEQIVTGARLRGGKGAGHE